MINYEYRRYYININSINKNNWGKYSIDEGRARIQDSCASSYHEYRKIYLIQEEYRLSTLNMIGHQLESGQSRGRSCIPPISFQNEPWRKTYIFTRLRQSINLVLMRISILGIYSDISMKCDSIATLNLEKIFCFFYELYKLHILWWRQNTHPCGMYASPYQNI